MSLESIQNQIGTIQRSIESLQRRIADKSKDEANKTARISQIQGSINNHTSASTLRSKMSEIERLQKDIGRVQQDRASLSSQVAREMEKLHRQQQELYKAQAKQFKDHQSSLERTLRTERSQNARRLVEVYSPAASDSSDQSNGGGGTTEFDAFVCHATEDKPDVAEPLAKALIAKGYSIWYDDFQLTVGDSLRQSIDRGLARSRYGIVVLSPSFFSKNWTQYELNGLVAKEMNGVKVVLPLWHKVSKDEVMVYSPSLADKIALKTADDTTEELAQKLCDVLRKPVHSAAVVAEQ